MDILNLITKILLILLLVTQLIVMIYLFFINRRRFQEDKKFWAHIAKEIEEVEKAKKQHQLYLEKHLEVKENIENEQIENQKQETRGSILGEGKTEDK